MLGCTRSAFASSGLQEGYKNYSLKYKKYKGLIYKLNGSLPSKSIGLTVVFGPCNFFFDLFFDFLYDARVFWYSFFNLFRMTFCCSRVDAVVVVGTGVDGLDMSGGTGVELISCNLWKYLLQLLQISSTDVYLILYFLR